MNRKMKLLALSAVLSLSLSGCAADGTLAGKDKPVDKEQTRVALCDGAQKVDIAFQTIARNAPGVVPPKVMDVEGTTAHDLGFTPGSPAAARDGSICATVYTGNLNVAINTAIAATADISALIAKWKQ